MIPRSISSYLEREGVPFHVHHHPSRITAQGLAAVEHVSGYQVAKSVVIKHGGGFALVVLPAPEHVDLEIIDRLTGDDCRLATEEEFARIFPDCEVGAMPPLGQLFGLPVFVDRCLARQGTITFNAGTHSDALEMAFADFARLTQPRLYEHPSRVH